MLRRLGVDPYATGPGRVIIAAFAVTAGFLAWRAADRQSKHGR